MESEYFNPDWPTPSDIPKSKNSFLWPLEVLLRE